MPLELNTDPRHRVLVFPAARAKCGHKQIVELAVEEGRNNTFRMQSGWDIPMEEALDALLYEAPYPMGAPRPNNGLTLICGYTVAQLSLNVYAHGAVNDCKHPDYLAGHLTHSGPATSTMFQHMLLSALLRRGYGIMQIMPEWSQIGDAKYSLRSTTGGYEAIWINVIHHDPEHYREPTA